jgi:hypothetical protein
MYFALLVPLLLWREMQSLGTIATDRLLVPATDGSENGALVHWQSVEQNRTENYVEKTSPHLLSYCTSPGCNLVMILEQLVDWMSGTGNGSTWRKPAPLPLNSAQIPHDLKLARTRPAAVESQRLSNFAFCQSDLPVLLDKTLRIKIACSTTVCDSSE